MKKFYRLPLAAIALSPTISAPLYSAETVDTVLVTATRVAETVDATLAPVSVISRSDIENSPAVSLPELLALSPGINLSNSGGHGKETSLYLRGTNSDQVLFLINGVKIGSATLGTVAIENIPLASIERIEIVRGPRSSLYGSEAVGGVIQIFTRDGRQGSRQQYSAAVGNNQTRDLSASFSGANASSSYNLSIAHFDTEGIDATTANSSPDADGYDNNTLSANFRHQLNQPLSIEVTVLRSDADNERDGSGGFDYEIESVQQSLAGKLLWDVNQQQELSLQVSESRDESEEFTDGLSTSEFNTRRRQLELLSNSYLGDTQVLTLGTGYETEDITSQQSYSQTQRDNVAIFGQLQDSWGPVDMLLGLRADDHDSFGRQTTGNLSFGYDLSAGRRLLASYGEAFHAPTFNDLYWPSNAFGAGNPNLLPEQSSSWELGYEHQTSRYQWSLRAFVTEIDNLIEWACTLNCNDSDFFNDFWQPSNVDTAKIEGLEFEWAMVLAGWKTRFSAAYLDARDKATGNDLPRRAKRTAQLEMSKRYGDLTTAFSFLAQSHRFDNSSNTKRLAGYGLTNVKLRYRLDPQWSLTAKVNNLFDRDYVTKSGFNSLGRNYLFGIDYGI